MGCFFTGAIPDCLESQEGDWKITYIIPRSPFVRYQYPNESPVDVIGGTNYAIASDPSQGQDPSKLYKVRTKITLQWRRNDNLSVIWTSSVEYVKRNIPGKITGTSSPTNWTSVQDGYSFFGFHLGRINTVNAQGQVVQYNAGSSLADCSDGGGLKEAEAVGVYKLSLPNGCPGQEIYYPSFTLVSGAFCNSSFRRCSAKIQSIEILSIELEPNQPPEGTNFLFTVRDCKGNLLFTRTDQNQPVVEYFSCEYKLEDEEVIYLTPQQREGIVGPYKGIVCTPTFALDGSKGTKLEIVGWPILQNTFRQTVLDIYSPDCCDKHPKICWECDSLDNKDLCPPFTCFKCLNDEGTICCYGDDGSVLKIVSTKDETPDC